MNRKNFLIHSTHIGLGCAAVFLTSPLFGKYNGLTQGNTSLTPCKERIQQGQEVIQRLLSQLDAQIDEASRMKIMSRCGRACFIGAHGERPFPPPTPEAVESFLDGMRKYLGKDAMRQMAGEMVIDFRYTSNPRGLKTSDGYCLCPIFETTSLSISPTYCACSVGYVQEMFERGVGKPVAVRLIDSVLRGGETCRFEVRFVLEWLKPHHHPLSLPE